MDVRTRNPYWLYRTPLLHTYNTVVEDFKSEVVVVGGGITGALVAHELVKAGCDVTIISNEHIGLGSTVASTSLLQYEIDTPLFKLIEKVGEKDAVKSYLLCHDSIDELGKIHQKIGVSKVFRRRKSLQLASKIKDVEDLETEYELRKAAGIKLDMLDADAVMKKFGFAAPAALYSKQAATTDAYSFTQTLINWCALNGAKVFDKTHIKSIQKHKNRSTLVTSDGFEINSKYVVMATGYESVKWLDIRVARLHSTYVLISEPMPKKDLWTDECLIWETATPYTYMRTTNDNRVIIGGKDETFFSARKRDSLMQQKSKQLLNAFNAKFPDVKFNIEFSWAGTFAETADGLPFIDEAPDMKRVYFALGFGGNGITFSHIAAVIIRDTILGYRNPDKKIFRFNRMIKGAK